MTIFVGKLGAVIRNETCQVEGCNQKAKFALHRCNADGSKDWLHVCNMHDKAIGADNAKRAGGRYKKSRRKA